MVVARSLSDVSEWEHTGTTFYIRQLPHRVMLRLGDLERTDQVEVLIRSGVGGWTAMEGVDKASHEDAVIAGLNVRQALTEECFDQLPLSIVGDLATAILKANQLTDEDVGN